MQTAIDRLLLGEEREINIHEFDGYRGKNRFVCPECGEYVFASVGKKNSFKHFKNSGKDCERRVDGGIELTYYERVGLPIYLINDNNNFSLHIGFYSLGEEILKVSQKEELKVYLQHPTSFGYTNLQFLIDRTFYKDETTLRPLNFIPADEADYKLSLSNENSLTAKKILGRWSNFADGFSRFGAIFSYAETRCKKLRKQETISVGIDYYFMKFDSKPVIQKGIISEFCNSFEIDNKLCYVYKLLLKPENDSEFESLDSYFWNNFKLKLLKYKPNLIQIWPPAIKIDNENRSINLPSKSAAFLKVQSTREEPKVYKYFNSTYSLLNVKKDSNNCNYVNLTQSKIPTPVSIDRKYLANSQLFSTNSDYDTEQKISVLINSSDLFQCINSTSVQSIFNENELNIQSNIQLNFIQAFQYRKVITSKITANSVDKVYMENKSHHLFLYSKSLQRFLVQHNNILKTEVINNNLDNIDITKFIKALNSEQINIPMKYKNIMIKLKKYPLIKKLIKSSIIEGKIPINVLKILVDGGLFNE